MTTLADIAEAARNEVYGYTTTQEPTTYLLNEFPADARIANLVTTEGFSRGIVQIDSELMLVDAVDRAASTIGLSSVSGRGIRGTKATAHPVGATVTMSPLIPRAKAQEAVVEALQADSGLFAVAEMVFPYSGMVNGYTLPPDFREVLNVGWLPPGGERVWHPIRRWSADRYSRSLVLGESPVPGHSVRVVYSTDVMVPTDSDADFSATGLPPSCVDVIRWSTAWRLTAFLEPYTLLTRSAEADSRERQGLSSSRAQAAQYMYAIYTQRLNEEIVNLQRAFPTRVHFSGTI